MKLKDAAFYIAAVSPAMLEHFLFDEFEKKIT